MIGTLNGETERLLGQGQDAARRGDKPTARSLLAQVVERDPHNELAWMWLSGVVESPEEQQICLENVLVINPQNTKARRGLDFVSTQTGIPPHLPPELSEPSAGASELTAPLTIDSPLYSELAGQQLPAWDAPGGYSTPQDATPSGDDAASLAFLAFMQNPAGSQPAGGREAVDAAYIPQFDAQDATGLGLQAGSWREGLQPLQQEQLDWGQPDAQFNVLSIADGIDERLAGFDTQGSALPTPWSSAAAFGTSPGSDLYSAAGSASGRNGSFDGSPQATTAASSMGQVGAMGPMGPMGPMGLHSDSNLPSPSELPKFEEPAEQPWYLKPEQQQEPGKFGSAGRSSSETSDGLRQSAKKIVGEMVDCPNCKASVPDTSLSCPQCKYSFFVNCPYCHELVDAADAKPGKSEPCPYCQKPINRLELGMAGTDSAISYKSARASSDSMSKQTMDELEASHKIKRPINFQWLVDVAWLVAIVATVWALSQLPTWLRLAGQY